MAAVIVIGGGPAGMMAAIRAAECGASVTLLEKNAGPGKKLLLSGKGRCNLTNACGLDEFLARFPSNGAFLRDAFKLFFNRELMDFFETRGLKLKVERQERVFPESDRSASVLGVLTKELQARGVTVRYRSRAREVIAANAAVNAVVLEDGTLLTAERVILAAGGVSYSATGSTGDGFAIAQKLGHTVTPLRPGLVGLETVQPLPCAGLTLKNIRVTFSDGKHASDSGVGELLFTHAGISGPLVFTMSGRVAEWLAQGKKVTASVDLKPALSEAVLDARLHREFAAAPRMTLRNIMRSLLPASMVDPFLLRAQVKAEVTASHVSRAQRERIIVLLKRFELEIKSTRPIEEAMVTCGGISLKELNPRTMESRIVKGLYFAGELIDVAADTGGFNLQAAFSTGYLAGESAAADNASKGRRT